MSEFACEYLTIRMYPYACLFLFISFIYAGKIINESNMKNWIFLAIFSCLCAFTHYFAALSAGLIYLGLLVYILFINDFDKVNEFKKWILSVIIAVILYIPWIFPLTQQLNDVGQSYWIPDVTFGYVVNCFAYYATVDSQLYMKAFAILVLIFFLLLSVKYYMKNKQNDDYYILFGFSIFIGTILVGIILSLVYKPILRVRYLLPSVCLIWFGISIYMGKIEDKRLLLVSILLILILGGSGIFGFVQDSDDFYQSGLNKQNLLETIDNENSTVISIGKAGMVPYCTGLSHCDVYTNSKKVLGVSSNDLEELFGIHYFKSDDYDDLINNNSGKDVYVIQKSYNKFDIGNNSKEIYKIGSNRFFYLTT